MDIRYGTKDTSIDVYDLVVKNNMYIPCDDCNRAKIFGDPLINVLKSIFINGVEYDDTKEIHIENNVVVVKISPQKEDEQLTRSIHSKLKFEHGSLNDEFPEQVMSVKYLKGTEKVLEIGGNVGRNSVMIGYILNQQNNNDFVTLECCTEDAEKIINNRDINGLKFHVEKSALSARKLIQNGWITEPSDVDRDGWKRINTITWKELNDKYNIPFDTLVLDCEGAFYYILYDTPEILDNIKMVIVENDYPNIDHKHYVINKLQEKGFKLDYQKYLGDKEDFYQVWLR